MPLPPHLSLALLTGRYRLPGIPGRCAGARFHSPTPLFVQAVRLIPVDWDGPAGPEVLLCGTCADNLSVLQQLLHAHQGALSWEVRREFGNDIRRLGQQGWEAFIAAAA